MANCRIVHFSDTHGLHEKLTIPDGDILVFSGDMGARGDQNETEEFFKWFNKQPHIYKIFVPGNHDRCFDRTLLGKHINIFPFWVNDLKNNFTKYDIIDIFAEHKAFEIKEFNLKFFGSAHTPKVHSGQGTYWAFTHEREDMGDIWKSIPEDTDILITHGPAYGKLDYSIVGHKSVGCERLRYKIERIKPKLHLFGHVHESYGVTRNADTYFVNSSITCWGDEINQPNVIDIDTENKVISIVDYK